MFSGKREANTLIREINLKQELINSELWGHDQVNFQNEGENREMLMTNQAVSTQSDMGKQENRIYEVKER